MKNISKNYFHFRKLFIIFCMLLCSYQLFSISYNYFSYPVIMELKIEEPQNFEIPDVSYCLSKEGVINMSMFYHHKHKWIHLITNNSVFKIYENYNKTIITSDIIRFQNFINFIFKNFAFNYMKTFIFEPNYIINNFKSFEKKIDTNYYKELTSDISISVISLYICYTVRPVENITFNYEELTSKKAMIDWGFFEVLVNHNVIKFARYHQIVVHPKGTNPRINEVPYPLKFEGNLKTHGSSLERQLVNRLPAPYQTNCLDYRTIGFENRAHALDDCAYSISLEYRYICCSSLQNIDIIGDNMYWYDDFYEPHIGVEEKYMNSCIFKYPQLDCYQQRFIPKAFRRINSDSKKTFSFSFYISYFETRSMATIKLELIDFLVDLGSILAFWFGISVLNVGDFFETSFYKLKTKIYRGNPINYTQNNIIKVKPVRIVNINH